jgi:hypothetical protein
VNAASLRASLSSSPALPIPRRACLVVPALSSSKLSRSRYQVPPRARTYARRARAGGVVHRAALACCCTAVQRRAAPFLGRPGVARATRRGPVCCAVCVCGLARAVCVSSRGSGVAWLVRAPLGASVSNNVLAERFQKIDPDLDVIVVGAKL